MCKPFAYSRKKRKLSEQILSRCSFALIRLLLLLAAAACQHSEVDRLILLEHGYPQCHPAAHGAAANELECDLFTVSKTNTELLQIILVGQLLPHTLPSPVPIYPFTYFTVYPPNPYDLHIKSCTMFGYQLVTYHPIPIYISPMIYIPSLHSQNL